MCSSDPPTRANTPSEPERRQVIHVSDSPPLFPPGARTNFGRTLFAPASSSTPAPSSVQAPPPAVSEAPGPAVTRGPPAVNGQLLSGSTSASDDILIVSCGHCDARNLVETPKDAYYVVFKGRGGVGIYRSMDTADPFFRGVPNAFCKRFTTRRAAFEALFDSETHGAVQFL